jgi:hypothetical protein
MMRRWSPGANVRATQANEFPRKRTGTDRQLANIPTPRTDPNGR